MAEIGLVASIFGVASFGTKVATGLYEAADIMIHARQQIASMAKHVSQFTAILRHLGRVLEAEKANCSKDLLHEIRKIKRSCKMTFKEINATVRSKTYRYFVPVRWLFRRSKAKELESRLDSEQSMLQVMIHTITVSKLGDLQSKSKQDSGQLTGLKEEIELLKTLIIESHNNVTNLQHAEELTKAEESQQPLPDGPFDHEPYLPNQTQGPPAPYPYPYPPEPPISQPPASPPSDSSNSDSDDEASSNKARASKAGPVQQPLEIYRHDASHKTIRASDLLLQMIPYNPASSTTLHSNSSNRLIPYGPGAVPGSELDPKPAVKEATRSIRLLLDKWTTSGSTPISDVLDAQDTKGSLAEDFTQEQHLRPPSFERHRSPLHRRRSMDNVSDSDHYVPAYNQFVNPHVSAQPGYAPLPPGPRPIPYPIPPYRAHYPSIRPDGIPTKEVWESPHPAQRALAGVELLSALRHAYGGIMYIKTNDYQHSYYIDTKQFFRFHLAPKWLIPPDGTKHQATEIGPDWVRREALSLLGYTYTDMPSGRFSIQGDLDLHEIEELVRLSYQADARLLDHRSKILIDERGWRERVNHALHQPTYPAVAPELPPGPDLRRHSQLPDPNSNYNREYRHTVYPWSPIRPARVHVENKADDPRRGRDDKPATSEVRFTLPHRDPRPGPTTMPQPSANPSPQTSRTELQMAVDKLELLKKKKEEAEKSKDVMTASDLTYYAIPELQGRIEKLKKAQLEDKTKSPTAGKPDRAPHTEVETDSESSEGSEDLQDKSGGSDGGSGVGPDLYE